MLLVVVDLRCLVFWLLTPFQGSVPEVMTTKYSHSASTRTRAYFTSFDDLGLPSCQSRLRAP
jgi:hypothetical protein